MAWAVSPTSPPSPAERVAAVRKAGLQRRPTAIETTVEALSQDLAAVRLELRAFQQTAAREAWLRRAAEHKQWEHEGTIAVLKAQLEQLEQERRKEDNGGRRESLFERSTTSRSLMLLAARGEAAGEKAAGAAASGMAPPGGTLRRSSLQSPSAHKLPLSSTMPPSFGSPAWYALEHSHRASPERAQQRSPPGEIAWDIKLRIEAVLCAP